EKLYSLLTWCSQFYQYPLGDTLHNAMPAALRKGKPADFATLQEWQITESGKDKLMQGLDRRAVKQQKVLQMLVNGALPHQEFVDQEIASTVLKSLEEKGWI
ncbi:primosomal protein N', partial [Escherichia coli]|nr:primosomal protein N' [Escherichia coli]